jgi:hypothetical protein
VKENESGFSSGVGIVEENEFIIFDEDEEEDKGYPWKGAIIANGIGAIIIICFIIPWVIGWVKMLQWIF